MARHEMHIPVWITEILQDRHEADWTAASEFGRRAAPRSASAVSCRHHLIIPVGIQRQFTARCAGGARLDRGRRIGRVRAADRHAARARRATN